MQKTDPLIVQIVGYKNAGKTTLLCRLVERFKKDGKIVGTIKHDAHDFEVDKPGTDTWKHTQSGADMTAITSPHRTVWFSNRPAALDTLVSRMAGADVILIEGFKAAGYPKLILLRHAEDAGSLLRLSRPAAVLLPDAWQQPVIADVPAIQRNDIDAIYRLILTL